MITDPVCPSIYKDDILSAYLGSTAEAGYFSWLGKDLHLYEGYMIVDQIIFWNLVPRKHFLLLKFTISRQSRGNASSVHVSQIVVK